MLGPLEIGSDVSRRELVRVSEESACMYLDSVLPGRGLRVRIALTGGVIEHEHQSSIEAA